VQPSTGTEDATSGQSYRPGPPSSEKSLYGAQPTRSTGGGRSIPDSYLNGRGLGVPHAADLNAAEQAEQVGQKTVASPLRAMSRHETHVTVLPPAGREEQLERWGLSPDRLGDHLFSGNRRGHLAEDAVSQTDDEAAEHELEARGFLQDGGWHAVEPTKGSARGEGTTSHRGVLHPEEHVDAEALRPAIEHELGFSYDDVRAVYRQGRKSVATLELRARIDARLLVLANAGANVAQLGRVLGFNVNASGACEALNNALARARKENA
jgi:hypothetical protein